MKLTLFAVLALAVLATAQNPGRGPTKNYRPRTRVYYIAAVEVNWNYAPSGRDLVYGGVGNEFDEFSEKLVYRKAVFREYTDASFTVQKNRTENETHLGILGPPIRAVVGDTVIVVFKNKLTFPCSFNGHGVAYNKSSEGAFYLDGTSGSTRADDIIQPNVTRNYTWHITAESGPGPNEESSVFYFYSSHVNRSIEVSSGLIGPIVVTRADWADPVLGKPLDVDRDFFVLFNIFNEFNSHFAQVNLNSTILGPEEGEETDFKHSLNGYIFGNLPGLYMRTNERVRWYVFAAGTEPHTPFWAGNTLLWHGFRVVEVPLTPYDLKTLTMVPKNTGTWLFYCSFDNHFLEGMTALYTVQ